MLYLAENKKELKKWKAKKWFPSDNKIKELLQKTNTSYKEIKIAVPEVFSIYSDLLQKANKYIHKQGYDTFYLNVKRSDEVTSQRTNLFVDFIRNAIQILLLMNIVLDPVSFALTDPKVDRYIFFDSITEPIPTNILDKIFDFMQETE